MLAIQPASTLLILLAAVSIATSLNSHHIRKLHQLERMRLLNRSGHQEGAYDYYHNHRLQRSFRRTSDSVSATDFAPTSSGTAAQLKRSWRVRPRVRSSARVSLVKAGGTAALSMASSLCTAETIRQLQLEQQNMWDPENVGFRNGVALNSCGNTVKAASPATSAEKAAVQHPSGKEQRLDTASKVWFFRWGR